MKQKTLFASALLALVYVWNTTPSRGGEHPEHPTAKAPAAAEESTKSAGLLDGKVFAGEIGTSGNQTGDQDQFVFKDSNFVSTACIAYGFNEAPYVATEENGAVSFTSEPENADGETMSWSGVIRGEVIEGSALYQTATEQTEYWFKGTLKTTGSTSGAAGSGTKSEHPTKPKKSEHPEHPR